MVKFWKLTFPALIVCVSAASEPVSSPFTITVPGVDPGDTLFQQVPAAETGIDFVNPIDTDHPDDRLYYSSMACGAVAAGDFDGDGQVDLFFANGPVANRLYRQTGAFRFSDVSTEAGVPDAESWSTGAACLDVDGDGDLDLYVTCYDSPNRLFLNESTPGKVRFSEKAAEWGLDIIDACLMPTCCDYDRDGDVDIFLVVNAYYRKGGRPGGGIPVRKTGDTLQVVPPWDRYFGISGIDPESGEPKYDEIGRPNILLRNESGRSFTSVSKEAGILNQPSNSNSAAWIDYDEDGFPDLYVGNDFSDRDEFYRNRGDGTFVEMAGDVFQHTTWFSMGSAAEDFNNDGLIDLTVADMLPTSHFREKVTMGEMGASFDSMFAEGLPRQKMVNSFFVNTGVGLFFETAFQSGLARSDWTWTMKSADYDGDGWVDLFLPTGHSRDFIHSDHSFVTPKMRVGKNYWDFYEDGPELREPNVAFRNRGGLQFEAAAEAWGLAANTMSYSAAHADLDRDGDLDLIVHQLEDPPAVYRNTARERGAGFLQVELPVTEFGARVVITLPDGKRMTRHLLPQNGYLESDEPVLHFGVGDSEKVSALEIRWNDGRLTDAEDLAINHRYRFDFPEDSDIEAKEQVVPAKPLFRESGSLFSLDFREEPFDDFERQPLLPHQHSQLGPGQAWGDLDGDGRVDLVLGGSSGKSTRVLLNRGQDPKGNPVFSLRKSEVFLRSAASEDLGVLLFEADGDGDLDLLVVSGGVESESFRNRLFLNDGSAHFTLSERSGLTEDEVSGSVAAAADFDRDGDLDVFIGGRIVPGKYPVGARSRLYVNDGGGRFEHRAQAIEWGESSTGLVTGAIWSDCDSDGWIDLLLTQEWGPIRYFKNREGTLVDYTRKAGLAPHRGWWNSIAGGDFDRDGDIDYLAGNFGRNTKYHPTMKKPEVLFYGDFDGTGTPHLVEAKYDENGVCLPRRGFSCSREAMPFLREKMGSFQNFARASLDKIYDPGLISSSLKMEATTFDTSLITNDGKGNFTVTPLPDLAQIAPTFGIAVGDFDGDGWEDVILAQNFYSPQKETGAMDGSLSLLLRGNPEAEVPEERFLPVWPKESGIVVPGDAKSAGVGDINGDRRPDVLIGVNNGPPRLLLNEGNSRHRTVQLSGTKGNPRSVGAKVTLRAVAQRPRTFEIYAGSGYLSVGEPTLFHAMEGEWDIEVIAPGGGVSKGLLSAEQSSIVVPTK